MLTPVKIKDIFGPHGILVRGSLGFFHLLVYVKVKTRPERKRTGEMVRS